MTPAARTFIPWFLFFLWLKWDSRAGEVCFCLIFSFPFCTIHTFFSSTRDVPRRTVLYQTPPDLHVTVPSQWRPYWPLVWVGTSYPPPLLRALSAGWVVAWCSAGHSACRCTAWALRLLRDQFHMTLAGGFRCHGDVSFFLHQGWLVIWVKVIPLPRSILLPDWAMRRHQLKWHLTHRRTHS